MRKNFVFLPLTLYYARLFIAGLKGKNAVILGTIAALIVPFILLTDVYPFFRFGMFAEPVQRPTQLEQFAIRYRTNDRTYKRLHPEQVGLSSLEYLMRNYYYRSESRQLLENIHRIYASRSPATEWQLLRITAPSTHTYRRDTTVAGRYFPAP